MDIRSLISSHVQTNWKPILLDLLTIEDEMKINKIFQLSEQGIPILPDPPTNIFIAFQYFDIEQTKAVIIGQDVYPGRNHAMGLAFSVPPQTKPIPPSLRNIFKELENEYPEHGTPSNPCLERWAEQNVLLLNTALTVQESTPGSHLSYWSNYTRSIIQTLANKTKNIVYFLWGNHAQNFQSIIPQEDNLVLKWSHPSPLSRKQFVGNNHFKLCNEYLHSNGKTPIRWI